MANSRYGRSRNTAVNDNNEAGDPPPTLKINKTTLRESLLIFRYVKPYRWQFAAGLLFIGLSSLSTMAFPYLLKLLIDSAGAGIPGSPGIPGGAGNPGSTGFSGGAVLSGSTGIPGSMNIPGLTSAAGHSVVSGRDSLSGHNGLAGHAGSLIGHYGPGFLALCMVGVLTVQMIFSYLRVYLFTSVGEKALADMRTDVYRRMIRMPMDFFAQRRVGELSSRISADLSQIQDVVTSVLAEILRGLLTLLIGLSLIFYISPRLSLMMLSVVPLVIVLAILFGRRIRKLSRQTQDQLADSNTIVQETLQGIGNVKAFSNEWYEIKRYAHSLREAVHLAVRNGRNRGLFVSFLIFSLFGTIILVVWFGVGLMQSGALSFGALTAFVVYTAFVGGSMAGFADLFSQLQKTLGATQRVRELLQESPEAINTEEEPLEERYRLSGQVELDKIAFRYPSRPDIPVLKEISLQAQKGQQIAFVGPSGAGKSTLAALLLRFYEPDAGRLSFDGRPAEEIPLSQLRKQMALVPQDILLFGGTIRENIAYGKPSATQAEIEHAALQAHAHEFISGFPEGYETLVGDRGIKLSGGQRQRIAIARAILKDPVILLLDEATSSLDSASERLVQDALDNLMKNRTSFIIAHRLSTIRHADRIVVLEKGMIKEMGTHQELLAQEDGLYRSLVRLQMEEVPSPAVYENGRLEDELPDARVL